MLAYGERVGVAFQLADDVIDLVSGRGAVRQDPRHGPSRGRAHAAGAAGAPRGRCRRPRGGSLGALLDGDLSDDATLHEVVRLLRTHPATEQAAAEARRWAQEAVEVIAPLPAGPARYALRAFAQAVVDRTRSARPVP